jgi:leucyl/phenylalanyl-tRNA---protein transferase
MIYDFPPIESRDEHGLLAVGGPFNAERVLAAYRLGIFPWYSHPPVLWWFMDPRFVLFPEKLHVAESLKKAIQKAPFTITFNHAFKEVVLNCSNVKRKGQTGTWITKDVVDVYTELHKRGIGISVEAWEKDKLVGGVYGLKIGNIFFGESMFSLRSNASKIAFVHLIHELKNDGLKLIDCQVYSKHLENFGAEMISGSLFSEILRKEIEN